MQGMDRKYNGHAWWKLVTTNIKNNFGLNFRKTRSLSQLHCMHDDCENFVCSSAHNELFWCGECVHIPIIRQLKLTTSHMSFGYKFCHVLLLCVVNYNGIIIML
jgi:hypothetical protein